MKYSSISIKTKLTLLKVTNKKLLIVITYI